MVWIFSHIVISLYIYTNSSIDRFSVEIMAGDANCQNRSDLIMLNDTQHTVDMIREDEQLWVEKDKKW